MAAEKNFENRVKKFLKEQKCWFLKTWGGGMQRSGIPDLLVCCNGKFVSVELKAPNGTPSELQMLNTVRIDDSGGFGWILWPEGFEDFKQFIIFLNNYRTVDACEIYIEKKGWTEE